MAAKSALSLTISAVKCPPTDLYQSLTNNCQRLWQVEWDGSLSNKLHSIRPTLVMSITATSVVETLLQSGGFALAILVSLIRISLIEKTNHDVLIATVH